jgi:hypothetical protein
MSSNAKISGLSLVVLALFASFFWIQADSLKNESSTIELDDSARLNRLVGLRERLTYEAYYGFMKLGDAVVEQYRDTTYKGQRRRVLRTVVTSNPKLLFVGYKEEHFSSIIANNDTTVYDLYYWKDDVAGKKKKQEEYEYDYRNGRVIARKPKAKADTLKLVGPSISGPAVIYHTRLIAGTGKSTRIPIFINQKQHFIDMKDYRRTEKVENTTFGNTHENAWYVDGDAAFDGPFGFSGKFKGWVMKDKYENVPLEGHVKVWIGSIRVKLVKYEKF